jgi:hypothetical protein
VLHHRPDTAIAIYAGSKPIDAYLSEQGVRQRIDVEAGEAAD